MIDAELKGIIDDLVKKFTDILNVNLFADTVNKELQRSYNEGLDKIGVQLNMNFTGYPERIDLLKNYTFDNIKGLNEYLSEGLRKEITQGLLNIESIDQIQKRVAKVMDIGIDRARMIARTEVNRAENMGHLDGARESGLNLMKQWDAHLDNRTSAVCNDLDGKRIAIDKRFVWNGQEFDYPPAHPNCRSTLRFIQVRSGDEKSISDLDVDVKHKYVRRTGSPGNYTYYYDEPKTGKERAPKEEDVNADAAGLIEILSKKRTDHFFSEVMSFQEFFDNANYSSKTWDKLTEHLDLPNSMNRYEKARIVNAAFLDSQSKEMGKKVKSMLTTYTYDTPDSVIKESKYTAYILAHLGMGFRDFDTPKDAKQEHIDKVRDMMGGDVKETNKALKYMGFKERVKKDGMRDGAANLSAADIKKSLIKSSVGGINYRISPNYVKNSETFKDINEVHKTFSKAVSVLPAKARALIAKGDTKVYLVNMREATKLIGRSPGKALGIYMGNSKDVYIFPPKEKYQEGNKKFNIDKEKMLSSGYDQEFVNNFSKLDGNANWEHTVVHELGHATALNETENAFQARGLQAEYNKFVRDITYPSMGIGVGDARTPEQRAIEADARESGSTITTYARTNSKEDFAETFAFYASNKQFVDEELKKKDSAVFSNLALKKKMEWMRDNLW